MSYIFFALLGHLFNGVANVMDKLVVSKYLKAASIYTFYVGVLTALAVVLIPFGVIIPSLWQLVSSLIIGGFFMLAFYLMNVGLLRGETTRVITIIGGSVPLFSLVASYIFLNERLQGLQIIAFILLLLGIVLMDVRTTISITKTKDKRFLWPALAAGLCYSLTFVGAKYVFNHQPFVSGFFWMRMGGVLCVLPLLFIRKTRQEIFADWNNPAKGQKQSKLLILANQLIGACGFVLINYAISLGSATIVNALQGMQFAFIFLIAALFGRRWPQLKEIYSRRIVVQKLLAIAIIAAGLVLLTW